jgi:hypothetical protein
MDMKWLVATVLVFSLTVGCNSNSSSPSPRDASASDAQTSYSLPDLPPGCPPAAGNEIGIGKPCTKTGTECTSSNLNCSCQDWFGQPMPATMPCFCTNVTFGSACASSCGSNASCCTYAVTAGLTVSACFPAVCAPNGQCPSITP